MATNALLFVIKIAAGVLGRSSAMIADALDTFGDVMTSAGMLVGYRIAKKPADAEHPYGHGKAESIIAKLLAIFLILLGLQVAYNAIHVMAVSQQAIAPGRIALAAAIVSIAVKLALFQYTNIIGRNISSTSMTLYSWNLAADAFSSLIALIGIAAARMGYPLMDPVAALILSVFVIKTGVDGFRRAYDELMDGAPPKGVIDGIRDIALQNKGVKKIKDIKVRKMGLELIIDMTIDVDKSITVESGHAITDLIRKDIISRVGAAKDVFIHVEPYLK